MQKLWLKKPKLSYSDNVIDVVQFGSSVIEGKIPADIDVAVIFKKVPIKEQLEERQKIKNQLKGLTEIPVHIESFDYYSLFDKTNFARTGILFNGRSLITGKNFSLNFGLIPKLRIKYQLEDLEKKEKVRFNYSLSGKMGNYGLIKKYGGKIISPGIVEISPEHEKIFLESMKKITSKITIERVFLSVE